MSVPAQQRLLCFWLRITLRVYGESATVVVPAFARQRIPYETDYVLIDYGEREQSGVSSFRTVGVFVTMFTINNGVRSLRVPTFEKLLLFSGL